MQAAQSVGRDLWRDGLARAECERMQMALVDRRLNTLNRCPRAHIATFSGLPEHHHVWHRSSLADQHRVRT